MSKYFRYPVNWVAITTYFSSEHLALDYGWNSSKGGQNVPIYAVADGVVFDIGRSTGDGNAGNYVWIKHPYNDKYEILTRSAHLQDGSIKVKVGQSVKQGQQIANMGGTYGYANHLHHDVWKVPKNYKFNWNDRGKYSVNPTGYLFLHDDQTHGSDANGVISVLGTSKHTKRDTSKNQLEIIGVASARSKSAGSKNYILGYLDYGIYDILEEINDSKSTYYKLADNLYVLEDLSTMKLYKIEEPKPQEPIIDEKDKKIEMLQEQIKELDITILQQKSTIEQQKAEIDKLHVDILKQSNLSCFCVDEDYIYLKLNKNDKIYYEK